MLVLSRKMYEAVILQTSDGPVTVQVVGIDRGRIALGFVAPRTVSILREELLEKPPDGDAA